MSCILCGSERIANVTAKCSDGCGVSLGSEEHDGYVPGDMAIGGGDYIEFSWCLDCLRIQAPAPLGKTELEPGRPKLAPLPAADKAAPETASIEARFGGTCACGARFQRGATILYGYVAARALRCQTCVPK